MKIHFPFNFILLHCTCIEISLVQGRYFIKALLLIIFLKKKKKKKKEEEKTNHTHQLQKLTVYSSKYMIKILLVSNIRKGFLDIQLSCWNNFL